MDTDMDTDTDMGERGNNMDMIWIVSGYWGDSMWGRSG